MRTLSQIIVGCSYMIALVLAIGWATGALRNIDNGASWSLIGALGCVVMGGLLTGLVAFLLDINRQGSATLPHVAAVSRNPFAEDRGVRHDI